MRGSRWIILVLLLWGLPTYAARSRIPISPREQKVQITFSSVYEKTEAESRVWRAFCENLGQELEIDGGAGFAVDHECGESAGSRRNLWTIHFSERKDSLDIALGFQGPETLLAFKVWSFALPNGAHPSFNGKPLSVALARWIIETLPTGRAFSYQGEDISFPKGAEVSSLPEALSVYSLTFDTKENVWIPRIKARLVKKGETSDGVTFYAPDKPDSLKRGGTYWVRGLLSREREKRYEAIVTQLLQSRSNQDLPRGLLKYKDDGSLLDIFTVIRASYAGLRFGRSLVSTNNLLADTMMISAFAELGTGWLAGLRWSYDLYPKISRGRDEKREYFTLRRASLGYSFGLKLPDEISPIFDTFDIQPKLGLLDLRSHFVQSKEGDEIGLDFQVRNVYDLAIESGLEKNTPWFRMRIWGSLSTANFGLSQKRATKVQNQRAGLDLYRSVTKDAGFDANVLVFLMAERLEFMNDPSEIDEDRPGAYSFGTNLVFGGLGFTMSW